MKKKGVTLLETVLSIALIGVIFLLVTPVIKSFGKVNTRVMTQKKIDNEFSSVNEFIQKKVRAAKRTGKSSGGVIDPNYIGVFSSFSSDASVFFSDGSDGNPKNNVDDGSKGSVLFLEVPDTSGNSDFIFFIFQDNELRYREGFGGTNEILMRDVEDASFKFQENILVYYVDLNIGSYEGILRDSLRSSASTRIDIQ